MYSGDQPLIACVIGGTALGLMLLVYFWSRRSDRDAYVAGAADTRSMTPIPRSASTAADPAGTSHA